MMKHIEKVGNIDVFAEKNAERDYTIIFINGADIIAQEVYFTDKFNKAVEDFFKKILDIYTEEWLYINASDLEKLTDNTYKSGEKDYFCRIDDTRFFKYYHKSVDEFVTDKNGMRIIDRQPKRSALERLGKMATFPLTMASQKRKVNKVRI